MLLKDVLTLKGGAVVSVPPTATVAEAVAKMVRYDMGSVMVTESDVLKGVLTFREILKAVHEGSSDFNVLQVTSVMESEPAIGHPDDPLDYVRGVMTDHHVRYLPVMENDRLLGVISFHDVARACLNEAQFENRLLKRYIEQQPESDSAT